jgi:hypothetical protein
MYLLLVGLQLRESPEAEIASRFGRASAQEVFAELRNYGFPVCSVCGTNPVVGEHCTPPPRKPRTVEGEPEPLPPPSNASDLFRETICRLESDLRDLPSIKETLQGGRFMSEAAGGPNKGVAGRGAKGGQWFPNPALTRLIGACLIAHGDKDIGVPGEKSLVERLLDQLHLEPTRANRKQLDECLYGRKKLDSKTGELVNAGDGFLFRGVQVATLIRGAPKLPTGRKRDTISPHEQYRAWENQAEKES